MVWLIFSSLVLLFTYLGQEKVAGKRLCLFYRSLLVVTLAYMIGFGGQLFTDHENYALFYSYFDGLSDYNIYNLLGKSGRFEFGFMLLAQIAKWLHLGIPGFLFLVAVIVNTLMIAVLYRFKYPLLSILMFITTAYFSQQANGVRQMIAVAIFLYSLQYLINNQTKKYLIGVLIAALFHFGAIVLMAFALLRYVDLNKHSKAITYSLLVVWFISALGALGLFHIGTLINISTEGAFSEYADLAEQKGDYNANFNPVYNIVLLLGLLLYKKEYKLYLYVYAIGCILLNISLASDYGRALYRFAYYFTPFFCLYTGELLWAKNYGTIGKDIKVLLYLVVAYYAFRLVYLHILNPEVLLGGKFYPITDFFMR